MRVDFRTASDAFQDGMLADETRRILTAIADRIEEGEVAGLVYDINGNRVGTWTL